MSKRIHTIHSSQCHHGWSKDYPPIETIEPGTTLTFECQDSSGGDLTAASTSQDILKLNFERINPVAGPIHIDGARPGDAVKVSIRDFEPSGSGWTAIIPGFGLLSDQFTKPSIAHWSFDKSGRIPASYGKNARVPLKPFAGTIGLAPSDPGIHSIVPPRRVGGNMDIRDLSIGSVLYLPVEVAGGLLSMGDTHAAQGDGEVCGSAIETAMKATVTLDLVKDARLASPRFMVPGPVTRHLDGSGFEATTGIGPDLMAAARTAVSNMVDLLGVQHGLSAEDAYMLCSVCGDLKISEIVDAPNWVVSFYFPRCVFD